MNVNAHEFTQLGTKALNTPDKALDILLDDIGYSATFQNLKE